ncbi:MAG: hypothetical protein NDI62_00790 [Burkholderiales bacterium]|nr:hypothetical protein [Burkholderiales bacterium]
MIKKIFIKFFGKKKRENISFKEMKNYLQNTFPKLPIDSTIETKKLLKSFDFILNK